MSSATSSPAVEYPESDGKPMGETDRYRYWTIRIHDILTQRYRDQSVYVGSDLLLYYEEGTPTRFVVPDCFVVLNCPKHERRTFQTWKEGCVPDVVIEVTSQSTRLVDTIDKPQTYEKIGVQEYILFDPTGDYLEPPLQGYRLTDGYLHTIPLVDGQLTCQTLGLNLSLDDRKLVMADIRTGALQLTEAESERRARELAERAAKREQAARIAADERTRQLEEELRRLKNRDS
ncbi:MAG: Uma2 family endonuclease [Planctomycetaceae bacterium]